ncbi:minor tail protein [Microbacterium phage Zayuliv]|nr:minor tail protein [Microbacterium phage Zayuliv]
MAYTPWVEKRRNLVTDPSFEVGISGWSGSSVAWSTDWAQRGTRSARGTLSNSANTGDVRTGTSTSFPFGMQAGKTYYVSAVVNLPALNTFVEGANSRQRRLLLWYGDSAGSPVAQWGPQVPNGAGVYTLTGMLTIPADAKGAIIAVAMGGSATDAGKFAYVDCVYISEVNGTYFDGGTNPNGDLERTRWLGTVNASASVIETRQTVPVIPIKNVTTEDVLYGDRVTSYRWEVLEHSNGIDQLVGILDGVSDGSLSWTQNAAVKGTGKAEVVDLDVAQQGMMRIAQLKLESVRLRPVQIIAGLPENPLGVYLLSAAVEEWEDTGRVWSLKLLDKCTVPEQDKVDQSYAVPAGTNILQRVKSILASAGEYIAIDNSVTLATSSGMVWEAGTSKLKIINELLDVAGYNALWMDGNGDFRVTPRVLPADRPINYEFLGIPRELRDGDKGIYSPDWNRERDSFDVPNKVVAVEAAGGEDTAALIGQWTNTDPASPYSYVSRGNRWITHTLDSVEVPDGNDASKLAFLQNRARATLVQMSAVQAQAKVEHLPIPVRVGDVLRFAHTKAGVDSRHVITNLSLEVHPLGMMKSTLQEVISL